MAKTLAEMLNEEPGIGRPRIVTILGSTRFKTEIRAFERQFARLGDIALSVGFFHHADAEPITSDEKRALDELMLRKIEMSDGVVIVNVGGYIGESTHAGLRHAIRLRKPFKFLEEKEGFDYIKRNGKDLGS